MSFGGNNSGYDDRSRTTQPQGGQRTYPQSYNDPGFGQPVKPSSNRALYWIIGVVSAVTIGGALVCCGGGYFLMKFGSVQLAEQFRGPVQASPEVAEHLGEIEDLTLSIRAMQSAGDQGKLVFEAKGTKGTGKVVVDLEKADSDPDNAFELVLSDGTRIPMTQVDLSQMGKNDRDPAAETIDPDAGSAGPEAVTSDADAVPVDQDTEAASDES